MKISIITVVLNDLEGLRRTAESVLSQVEADYEYVVLDGGSTDGSWEYIESLEFCGVKKSESDSGIYNAMNRAVHLACGEYCLFMNAGDTFYDEKVLQKASGVIGRADFYVGHTKEIGKTVLFGWAPDALSLDYLMRTSIYHQSSFIRRSLLLEYPYNEQHKVVSDWEFIFERWLNGCTYEKLDFFVSNYYIGGFSFTHQDLIAKERREFMEKLLPKRVLDGSFLSQKQQGRDDESTLYKLKQRLEYAYSLSPIRRDLKVIRYGFKYLFKDIFARK